MYLLDVTMEIYTPPQKIEIKLHHSMGKPNSDLKRDKSIKLTHTLRKAEDG